MFEKFKKIYLSPSLKTVQNQLVKVNFQQGHLSTGKGHQRLKKFSILLKNDPGYFHDFLSQFSTLKKVPPGQY